MVRSRYKAIAWLWLFEFCLGLGTVVLTATLLHTPDPAKEQTLQDLVQHKITVGDFMLAAQERNGKAKLIVYILLYIPMVWYTCRLFFRTKNILAYAGALGCFFMGSNMSDKYFPSLLVGYFAKHPSAEDWWIAIAFAVTMIAIIYTNIKLNEAVEERYPRT